MLAKAVYQVTFLNLTYRLREQARSHSETPCTKGFGRFDGLFYAWGEHRFNIHIKNNQMNKYDLKIYESPVMVCLMQRDRPPRIARDS